MKFDEHISKLLNNPYQVVLEADKNRHLIPDNLYQAYVKYVGKLDALPHEELSIRELSNPNTGQVFPITSWPTKSTRKYSSEKWTAYNTSLQEPGSEVAVNPCSDPDKFVSNAMRDCVSVNKTTKKCEKQIGMLKQAVQDYCGTENGEEYLQRLANRLSNPFPKEDQ